MVPLAPAWAFGFLVLISLRGFRVPTLDHERNAPVVVPELTKQERDAQDTERKISAGKDTASVLAESNFAASAQNHQQAMELVHLEEKHKQEQADRAAQRDTAGANSRPAKRAKTSHAPQAPTDPKTAKMIQDLTARVNAAEKTAGKISKNLADTQNKLTNTQEQLHSAVSKNKADLKAAHSQRKADETATNAFRKTTNKALASTEKQLGKRKAAQS